MPLPRRFLVLAALLLATPALGVPALGADFVYPPGSRIGLIPPPGLTTSKSFFGFEDRNNNVAVVMTALPAAAFAEIDKTANAENLQRQGVTFDKREAIETPIGPAFLIIGHQDVEQHLRFEKYLFVASTPELTALVTVQLPESANKSYPDAAIRTALASVAVRVSVPTEEQLSLLPFDVSDLSGFKVAGVLPGRAVMLSDSGSEAQSQMEPHIVVAASPGSPAQAGDREAFARDIFTTIPNLKDVRITNSESLRLGGLQGHQIMASAIDAVSGAEVTVVQWIRFGGGGFLQVVAVAPLDAWPQAYPRFRAVRDGISPH